jgi:hypothetical protein
MRRLRPGIRSHFWFERCCQMLTGPRAVDIREMP